MKSNGAAPQLRQGGEQSRRLAEGEEAGYVGEARLASHRAAREAGLLSDEHFTVDGTLIEAWAGQKSFRPKDEKDGSSGPGGARSSERDFHGERRKNDTHASTTDPEARLFKKGKGKEAKLCFMGHVITENRNGLVVATETTLATGTAEREASERMMKRTQRARRSTLGGDKNYDTQGHVRALRELGVAPHVAQNNKNRRSAIDDRTTTHVGYEVSQRKRKCIEQVYGWGKEVGPIRKAKHRGVKRVDWVFTFTQAAYNLVRMRPLLCPT